MLSGISRNPYGVRRDHTQHALIPLLRALWARVYLPTYPTYAPGYCVHCVYAHEVSDIRIRDRYCNLDELSSRHYYEELKIGKEWKVFQRWEIILLRFEAIIFLHVNTYLPFF